MLTDSVIVTDLRSVHFSNAFRPISYAGITADVRAVQPLNAYCPIVTVDSGIDTEIMDVHS